jgi:hypothetical protein
VPTIGNEKQDVHPSNLNEQEPNKRIVAAFATGDFLQSYDRVLTMTMKHKNFVGFFVQNAISDLENSRITFDYFEPLFSGSTGDYRELL